MQGEGVLWGCGGCSPQTSKRPARPCRAAGHVMSVAAHRPGWSKAPIPPPSCVNRPGGNKVLCMLLFGGWGGAVVTLAGQESHTLALAWTSASFREPFNNRNVVEFHKSPTYVLYLYCIERLEHQKKCQGAGKGHSHPPSKFFKHTTGCNPVGRSRQRNVSTARAAAM